MSEIYLYTFGSVLLVSLVSFVGVFFLSLKEKALRKYIFIFISIAVGALLGDALIHLIPQALEESANPLYASLLVISGIVLFFILENFLHWHHHGEDSEEPDIHPMGKLVLFSDGVHNFIDGMIIGASFLASVPLGVATTLAVILHEIPQEIGDFAVLLHSGYAKSRALWLNFLSAVTSILGVIVLFSIGESVIGLYNWFLPVAAGGFIYVAVADLIPELRKNTEKKNYFLQLAAIIVGVTAMALLAFSE